MSVPYRLHYAPDNASLIVRLALTEIGQPFETVLVNRAAGAHLSAAYLALNPNGLIPVLETPDGPIFETGAILLWLADRHGQLAPAPDSPERAAFLKWHFRVANTLHPALRMRLRPDRYTGADTAAQAALRAHMKTEIAGELDKLEKVAGTGPGWLGGPAPSVIDFYLACLLRWLTLYPAPDGGAGWLDLRDWPHLHAMAARLEHCPSVRAAIRAEGLGPHPFTAPEYATPPEGSAT
ncbi:glutathione S-transferase family protein [Roseovarius sp. SYSU LYC5161]|uniref:glutathione S-transferase family protein n=1 Tax=Roseovarius halophilus (ex Wu et al. 2025) TaxID=3376060 RepID=UPI003999E391